MTQIVLPPNNSWKLIVPETQIQTGVLSPVLPIPTGIYKTLRCVVKCKDTVNVSGTESIILAPFAAITPSDIPVINRISGGALATSSPGASSGALLNCLLGTNAPVGSFTHIVMDVYGCDLTTDKWAYGSFIGITNNVSQVITGWWTEVITTNQVVDGFRLLTTNARMSTGSTYKVWQIE